MAENCDQKELPEKSIEDPDAELDLLLDYALADFTGKVIPPAVVKKSDKSDRLPQEKVNVYDELARTAMQFEAHLDSLAASQNIDGENSDGGLENLTEEFKKMAEAAAKSYTENTEESEFSAAIAQTLKNLSENSENLQSQFADPEEMAKMFEKLDLDGTEGLESNPVLGPFFQQIIQTFFSKEVLYPSMKELLDKYPAWLDENKNKLPEEEFANYVKQQTIMAKVCHEFELETEADSSEVSKTRFQKIMELMKEIQACGQPPKELMGNMAMDGIPNFPSGTDTPDHCNMQ